MHLEDVPIHPDIFRLVRRQLDRLPPGNCRSCILCFLDFRFFNFSRLGLFNFALSYLNLGRRRFFHRI